MVQGVLLRRICASLMSGCRSPKECDRSRGSEMLVVVKEGACRFRGVTLVWIGRVEMMSGGVVGRGSSDTVCGVILLLRCALVFGPTKPDAGVMPFAFLVADDGLSGALSEVVGLLPCRAGSPSERPDSCFG